MFDGHNDRLEREHNQIAWEVWHTSGFIRGALKFPRSLDKLQSRQATRKAKAMTPDEMWAVMLPMTYAKD